MAKKIIREVDLMVMQESGHHVIESNIFPGVNYIMKGDAIGITTYSKGSITMDLDAFRAMVVEALEAFDFWEGV